MGRLAGMGGCFVGGRVGGRLGGGGTLVMSRGEVGKVWKVEMEAWEWVE